MVDCPQQMTWISMRIPLSGRQDSDLCLLAIETCPVEAHFDVPPMSFSGSLPLAHRWTSRVFRYVLMLKKHDTLIPITHAAAAGQQPEDETPARRGKATALAPGSGLSGAHPFIMSTLLVFSLGCVL
jgi:hypothetical protein